MRTAVRFLAVVAALSVRASDSTGTMRTVAFVDLERYAGTWYEIAKLPNRFQKSCVGDVTAEYRVRDDGRLDVTNRCTTADGDEKQASGVARIVDEKTRSKLEVRFAPAFLSFLPMVWGDYWILDLAADYSHVVIGEPRRRYLWILARESAIGEAAYAGILERVCDEALMRL